MNLTKTQIILGVTAIGGGVLLGYFYWRNKNNTTAQKGRLYSGAGVTCKDGTRVSTENGYTGKECIYHGGESGKQVVDNGYGGLPSDYCMYNPNDIICQPI
jgi:hypothetical protein